MFPSQNIFFFFHWGHPLSLWLRERNSNCPLVLGATQVHSSTPSKCLFKLSLSSHPLNVWHTMENMIYFILLYLIPFFSLLHPSFPIFFLLRCPKYDCKNHHIARNQIWLQKSWHCKKPLGWGLLLVYKFLRSDGHKTF